MPPPRPILPRPDPAPEVLSRPARQELNAAYIRGGLIVAACLGALAQTWLVFAITAVILLGLSLIGGEIRPRRRRR